jgi:hypothetical protein
MEGFGTLFGFLLGPWALVRRVRVSDQIIRMVNPSDLSAMAQNHPYSATPELLQLLSSALGALRALRAKPFVFLSSIQDSPNLDFGKQAVLEDPDLFHPDEFQQGQECDRNLGPTRRVLEKIEK